MSHYLLFLSWFNQLFNNLFFTYCPKFLLLADMFNAAALAAAPQLVRDDAPVPCPANVAALLAPSVPNLRPNFEKQTLSGMTVRTSPH
jgi:hypothetical protein